MASKSPRRQEILQLMGFGEGEYEVIPSAFPEDLDKAAFATPADYATTNAECKAKEVATKLFAAAAAAGDDDPKKSIIVIGSDTIVDRDGTILEKPDDDAHAHAMITSLAGRQHLVHSGVAIFSSRGPRSEDDGNPLPVASFCETARVTFAPLTEEEIWAYVRTGEPRDKAGSYGIQGFGGQIVRGVDGCFFAVMGLPMHRLSEQLARLMAEGLV